MPLSQTNFFPLFTQVNFLPETIEVTPALVQGAPAFAIPNAGITRSEHVNEMAIPRVSNFFIEKCYLALLDLSALSTKIGGDSSTRKHRPCVARSSSKNQ